MCSCLGLSTYIRIYTHIIVLVLVVLFVFISSALPLLLLCIFVSLPDRMVLYVSISDARPILQVPDADHTRSFACGWV